MSLGKDLASIRESQKLTLDDVQKAIKIPVLTLKSIENDSIFSENAENKTYRRSFIRSYAKLLRLDDEDVVRALDAMEKGKYRSEFLTGLESDSIESETIISDDIDETDQEIAATPPPADTPLAEPKPNDPPTINTVNWADMGKKFNTVSKGSKSWMALIIFILVALIGGGAYIFSDQLTDLFDGSPADQLVIENEEPITAILDTTDTSQLNETAPADVVDRNETIQDQQPINLEETLTVAVYAAYGQLEPIRITSDLNWRTNPFWMEEGEAYYFDFQDTLLIRGQYSRLILLFNGHPIENPRQNYFDPEQNSIMLTRSILNQARYLAPPPSEFPLEIGPPDSIVYRLSL